MMHQIRRIGFGWITTLAIIGYVGQAPAADEDRFEVSSIKAVRSTLVDTITALQQSDVARAKEAFEHFDSAWNGIEVYVNTHSRELYQVLEHDFQPRITKALEGPSPDLTALLSDARAMLAKFDELVSLVAKAAPLSPLFDDVARLRIVRAHLREVIPALKAGNVPKARKSFAAFDNNWDRIEDLIKDRSADAYVAIEKGMIQIDQALMPDKPDVAQVTALVTGVTNQYNAILVEVMKEARSRR
jgi:hypothetical protein